MILKLGDPRHKVLQGNITNVFYIDIGTVE